MGVDTSSGQTSRLGACHLCQRPLTVVLHQAQRGRGLGGADRARLDVTARLKPKAWGNVTFRIHFAIRRDHLVNLPATRRDSGWSAGSPSRRPRSGLLSGEPAGRVRGHTEVQEYVQAPKWSGRRRREADEADTPEPFRARWV